MTFTINNWNLFESILNPMDQFEIRALLSLIFFNGSLNLTLTNTGLYLILIALLLWAIAEIIVGVDKLREYLNPKPDKETEPEPKPIKQKSKSTAPKSTASKSKQKKSKATTKSNKKKKNPYKKVANKKVVVKDSEKIISTPWSLSLESMHVTLMSIVRSQIMSLNGQIYFPFMITLFIFILSNNLVGLIPYSFATTSQFVLTFALSFTVVLGATILGLDKHGLKFFSLLVPAGCPIILLPLLVLIEFISYCARCVSLGLRLGANIVSGHLLLNILSTFVYKIMGSNMIFFILGLLPLALIMAFSGLEFMIAIIQAQVFVVLASSYIKDGLNLH